MPDVDCKSVTGGLSRLSCKEETPISGSKNVKNVCNSGIVEDEALGDSTVNTGFIILGVSEGKAGVNVITEGSNNDVEREDSNSVCPDRVS